MFIFKTFKDSFNKVLICVGRIPNTSNLNIEKTGIKLDEKGFIPVNEQRRTLIPNIYAIGDVSGNPWDHGCVPSVPMRLSKVSRNA